MFGRAVRGDDGLWLQYWFFYIYNDAQFAGRVDLHEGDWEMIQLLIGDDDAPVSAVYAPAMPTRSCAPGRRWNSSHPTTAGPSSTPAGAVTAPISNPGLRRTYVAVDDEFHPLWWDAADGEGRQVTPQLELMDRPVGAVVRCLGRHQGADPVA